MGIVVSAAGCAGVEGDSPDSPVAPDPPADNGRTALAASNLEIHQINVGWGSSVLVVGPDRTTVLLEAGDTGKGTSAVVPYLQARGFAPAGGLDYTIVGHQHCDHLGGLDEVVSAGYDVRVRNYFNGSSTTSSCVTEWNSAAAGTTAGAAVVPVPGAEIALGDGARLIFVAVNGQIIGGGSVAVSNENDRSIAVLLKYRGFDYLWASDMGGGTIDEACTGRSTLSQVDVETSVVQAISPGGASPLISAGGIDVMNVNHHGSESSTNMNWMNYSAPAVALVGTGAGQSAGWDLPRIDVVEHVLSAEASCVTAPAALVLQTEEGAPAGSLTSTRGYCVGDIMVSTDGQSSFTVSADGHVTEGPNEVMTAELPRVFAIDDAPAAPDTQAPVTAMTAPVSGASVSGTVAVTASASDDVGVSRVELWIDGVLQATDTTAPYAWSWDTSAVAAGSHDLWTEAFDAAGNRGIGPLVSVTVTGGAPGRVILNEILANEPGADTTGEFVELVNVGGQSVDIGGWTISDATASRHTFAAGSRLVAGGAVVVFAGASAIPPGLGNAVAASSGVLSLNNSGDTVRLADATAATIDLVSYGSSLAGTDGVSMNRNPDADAGGTFVLHTTIAAATSSPGRRADGSEFATCDSSTSCSDGNACNGVEICQAGRCVAGAVLDCDDGNPCTDDSCAPATGCGHASNTATCDDGDACNGAETCQAGSCVAGAALDCDDGNPCTDDSCAAATGCGHASNTATCDDGNACTSGDVCQAGVCRGSGSCGPSVIASDGFEGGFTGGTGWSEASWRVSGDAIIRTVDGPHSGTRHVRLRQSTGSVQRKVALSGRTGARLHVWTKVSSWESADRAQIRVTVTPGTGYSAVLTQGSTSSDGVYHFFDLDLGACDGAAACEIFFDAQMNSTSDYWYIDDVEVTAF